MPRRQPERRGFGDAVDPTGVSVAGSTWLADFPTTPGALQPGIRRSEESTRNGFIAKLDLGGSHLAYATFLPMERVGGIAIDHAGAAYVSGGVTPWTATIFTPTPGAFQPTPGSDSDAVIVKLDPEARRLVYATYLSGSELDGGGRIAVDTGGAAYVTGETQSPDFPVTPTAPRRRSVLFDTFAAKLDPTGGALLYATYLGCDSVSGMALGPGDVASVTGATFSTTSPRRRVPSNPRGTRSMAMS
jgi:hypothetical protein